MYKIMIHIDTHTNDTWFYYQEAGKDYVANSLEEIRSEKKRLEEELLKYEAESLLKEGKRKEKYTVIKKIFLERQI